jgi:hypothetical protein
MLYQAHTAKNRVTGYIAALPRLHVEWPKAAHRRAAKSQVSDVGGAGALMTAIVVLCTCILLAVLIAVFMFVS